MIMGQTLAGDHLIWTNTFYTFDKSILQARQIHLAMIDGGHTLAGNHSISVTRSLVNPH